MRSLLFSLLFVCWRWVLRVLRVDERGVCVCVCCADNTAGTIKMAVVSTVTDQYVAIGFGTSE